MSIDLTSAPQDDEQDYYSKNDHKNYEQAYYIGYPARRQGTIDVPIICFVFISFHVATPLVSVPPLLKIRLQTRNLFQPPSKQFVGKHWRTSTAIPGHKPLPENSVKNYMSDKIGAADSGIITIDQPAGLARENII